MIQKGGRECAPPRGQGAIIGPPGGTVRVVVDRSKSLADSAVTETSGRPDTLAPVVLTPSRTTREGPALLRITSSTANEVTTLTIEGRLDRESVGQLDSAVPEPLSGVVLDLSSLRFADPAGIDQLRKLIAAGARASGASIYIAQLLGLED